MIELLTRGQYSLQQEESDTQGLRLIPLSHPKREDASHPVIEILEIDETSKRCLWMMRTASDGSALAQSAALGFLALEYAFERLNLRKVHVELCADEIQLLEIHRKLGFCEEGRLIRHVVKSDKAWDVILLAHFKESWEKKRKNLEPLVSEGGSFQ